MTSTSHAGDTAPRLLFVAVAVLAVLVSSLPMASSSSAGKGAREHRRANSHYRRRHVTVRKNITTCAPPADIEHIFQGLNSQVNNLQFLRPAANGAALIAADVTNRTLRWLPTAGVNRTCPDQLVRLAAAPLEQRALCPYYFDVMVLPEGYYPRRLKFARCKCQECVEHPTMSCIPVTTPVTLLRAIGCLQGLQRYKEVQMDVITSCACAFKGGVVGGAQTRGAVARAAGALPVGEQ